MALFSFVFLVIILALVAIAIYEHVISARLSLPLTPALTIFTILLPLLAACNTFTLPYLARKSSTQPDNTSLGSRTLAPAVLQILQVLQGIITSILGTLYLNEIVPGATRECGLATHWQRLFRAREVLAVRSIQDTLDCCGFRSVKDMAWPFPPAAIECSVRFARSLACREPWTSALQATAGGNFGVVLAVGVLQIISILVVRHYSARFQNFSWSDVYQRRPRPSDRRGHSSRPLLTSGDVQMDDSDEEDGETGRQNGHGYGAMDNNHSVGPRVEPAGLQSERDAWQEG